MNKGTKRQQQRKILVLPFHTIANFLFMSKNSNLRKNFKIVDFWPFLAWKFKYYKSFIFGMKIQIHNFVVFFWKLNFWT